jgi:hypothetical protein
VGQKAVGDGASWLGKEKKKKTTTTEVQRLQVVFQYA